MSVQRWKPRKATQRFWSEGMTFDADGAFVTYADHVAALAEALQEAREVIPDNDHKAEAELGLDPDDYDTHTEYGLAIAKAAIDALITSRSADA